MKFNFSKKNVFISGGTHGIGLGCAVALANLGANIITFSRDQKKIKYAKKILSKFGNLNYVTEGDALKEDSLNQIANEVLKKYQKIDILINNVGGGGRWGNENLFKTKKNVWDEVYEKNVNPLIIFTNKFLPGMILNKWGRVITIGSNIAFDVTNETRPWFSAAKASQVVIMKSLSKRTSLVRNNITFNTISPGPIFIKDTGWASFKKNNKRDYLQWIKKNIPINRIGKTSDVSNLVIFLSSEHSSYINGQNIVIDGGQTNTA
jgi:NAD(P)-dependent dehydrogenase (short-subunit alcohol dehydrogenase family)